MEYGYYIEETAIPHETRIWNGGVCVDNLILKNSKQNRLRLGEVSEERDYAAC